MSMSSSVHQDPNKKYTLEVFALQRNRFEHLYGSSFVPDDQMGVKKQQTMVATSRARKDQYKYALEMKMWLIQCSPNQSKSSKIICGTVWLGMGIFTEYPYEAAHEKRRTKTRCAEGRILIG